MSIEEILTNIGNYFTSFGNSVLNFFVSVGEFFSSIYNVIINISSFVISIFGFIFHALKTLLVGVWNLILYVVNGNVWIDCISAMTKVSDFIGFPATMFIFAMLLLIITKILISFITKLFKLGADYNMRKSHWDRMNSKLGKMS